MAGSNFDNAVSYMTTYLTSKDNWMSNNGRASWFTSGVDNTEELMKLFDPRIEDREAYRIYDEMKDPDSKIPKGTEAKYRLRVMFLAAATVAVRRQYMAGTDNRVRTQNDTYRYEMANARAVRATLAKFRHMVDVQGIDNATGGSTGNTMTA